MTLLHDRVFPEGFVYKDELLSSEQERALVERFCTASFQGIRVSFCRSLPAAEILTRGLLLWIAWFYQLVESSPALPVKRTAAARRFQD